MNTQHQEPVSKLDTYLNTLRYRPEYFPKGFLLTIIYPLSVIYAIAGVMNLLAGEWPYALLFATLLCGLLLANHFAYNPRYYCLLPVVVALVPTVSVFVSYQHQPIISLFWSIAIPCFYFSVLHYRRALEFVVVLNVAYTAIVYFSFSELFAARFFICISLVTLMLYKMLSALEQNYLTALHLATVDELTQLLNRRSLNEKLNEYVGLKQRHTDTEFTLAIIDLDYFKQVNDELGHLVGDEALKIFSATLRERVRKVDIPARYGGDEFALLLPHSSVSVAGEILDDCRQQLTHKPFGDGRTLKFSAGITSLAAGESVDEWLSRCDRALYAAKNDGRNCNRLA